VDDERKNKPGQEDENENSELIEDLEPTENDNAAVKGGGPKEQQSLPGGGPTD
jgi:hypothetical protein